MHANTLGQTAQFPSYKARNPNRRIASRPLGSIAIADVLAPALWSGIGLALSAPFIFLLSDTMAAEDTFAFVVGLLG